MDVKRASRAVTDMDRAKKMHLHEELGKQLAREFNRANSSKATSRFHPSDRKTQRGNVMTTLDGQGDSCDEVDVHELPRVAQLNLNPSLMGVQIYDDIEHFFSRQSSTSSMFSEKFRSGVAIPCCRGGPEQGASIGELQKKRGMSIVTSSDPGKRTQRGTHLGETGSRRLDNRPPTTTTSFEKARAASGLLYPSLQVGGNPNNSILNAVHFTFSDVGATGNDHVTDKIFKQLLEQARSQKCSTHGGGLETMQQKISSRTQHQTQRSSAALAPNVDKPSPVSTLVSSSSASLTFSERLFGYEFSKDSFRRQSQRDAKSSAPPLASQCKSMPISVVQSDYEDTDDDDIIIEGDIIFEIPTFHCSREQQYGELVMVRAKPRRPSERWSSHKKSFNLNLKQPHEKSTSSINVNGSKSRHHRSAADPQDEQARAKLDVSQRDIAMSSLSSSFDGAGLSWRLKRGTLTQLSSFASERSGWLEFESEILDDFVLDSGRLKIDVSYNKPDLDKPYVEELNNGRNLHDGVKMDEDDFPFNSPIASSFVFGEERSEDHVHPPTVLNSSIASMARRVVLEMDFDKEDLDLSDAFHDPEDGSRDGSISDTDSSLTTFSLEIDSTRDSNNVQGQIDQHPQWISTRSFNYLREVVDHNSGFLNIESRSGRFSVDLRQEKRLEKVEQHQHCRPGLRVSMRKKATGKSPSSSRRSLLAPCLVCLSCIHQRPAQEQP